MAAPTREDRALMRVRGAGSRKVPTIDFGFDFGFGQTTQQNPTPARLLRSTTKAPQPRSSTSRQRIEASDRRSRDLSAPRSVASARTRSSISRNELATRSQQGVEGDGSMQSAKRRRITPGLITPTPSAAVEAPRTRRSSRATRSRIASSAFKIAEDVTAHEVESRQPQPPLNVLEDDSEKENEIPGEVRSKPSPDHAALASPIDVVLQEEEILDTENEDAHQSILKVLPPRSATTPAVVPLKKRSNRKSLLVKRKRRRASSETTSATNSRQTTADFPSLQVAAEEPSSITTLPLADRISKYSKLARVKNLPSQSVDREEESRHEEENDYDYVQSSPAPETPAATKKVARKAQRQSSRNQANDTSRRNKSKETFPVVTYRLTNLPRLPTIHENVEDEDTTVQHSFEGKQPNVVDVLAQICQETISNMIERMPESTNSAQKLAVKNKRTALQAFSRDLSDELFAMSEAVENRIKLEARARKVKREKAALQHEYLELRREREEIALKCDALRRQHWDDEEETRQRFSLGDSARRVKRNLQNEADTAEGLEFLLRTVADTASSFSGQGGILDRIKSFNAQLESVAQTLEGRDA